jgi:hypothetical protein
MGSNEDGSEDYGDENGMEEDFDVGINELPDQTAMKRELKQAIEDERQEYQGLKELNEQCQRQIILMEASTRDYEKQSD